MTDELRRAYAVLGLAPGSLPWTVKRQYKALVKRWHPDQFSNDPTAQAAAAQKMSEINGAYRTIKQAALDRVGPLRRSTPAPRAGPRSSGGVSSTARGHSDLEDAFESFFWCVGALRSVIGAVFAFGCAVGLVVALVKGDLQTLRRNPEFAAMPLLVGLGAALYLVERRAARNNEGLPREETVEQNPRSDDLGGLVAWRGVLCLLMGLVALGWEWSSDHRLRASGGAWGLRGGFWRADVLLLVFGWVFSLLGLRILLGEDGTLAGERSQKLVFVGLLLGLANAYWLGAYQGLSVDLLLEWSPLFVLLGLFVALLRWTASGKPPES